VEFLGETIVCFFDGLIFSDGMKVKGDATVNRSWIYNPLRLGTILPTIGFVFVTAL
jgi:hypothetical protein